MEIVFQLIVVEPGLPDVDSGIVEDRGLVRSEAVRYLCAVDPGH